MLSQLSHIPTPVLYCLFTACGRHYRISLFPNAISSEMADLFFSADR
jgi:hypothetical protein